MTISHWPIIIIDPGGESCLGVSHCVLSSFRVQVWGVMGGEMKECTLDGLSSDRGAATGDVLMSYLVHIPASFLSRQRILTLGIQHV
jgi:hypothetical protein